MRMVLDNLILNVKQVTFNKYEAFIKDLREELVTWEVLEHNQTPLATYTKATVREYHYNAIVGRSDGAVYIGYQHNAEKYDVIKGCSMKLEVNPSKENKEQTILTEVFKKHFEGYEIFIRGMDLAVDLETEKNSILPVSLTGRHQDRHKGTIYFGTRGKHGYLRIYDKKKELKEKQKIEITEESLTRIEFCARIKDGLTLKDLEILDWEMNDLYQVSFLDESKLPADPITKAILYSYVNGYQDLKEFTRTYKTKIKEALSNMSQLDLDKLFENAKPDIRKILLKFINDNQDVSTL